MFNKSNLPKLSAHEKRGQKLYNKIVANSGQSNNIDTDILKEAEYEIYSENFSIILKKLDAIRLRLAESDSKLVRAKEQYKNSQLSIEEYQRVMIENADIKEALSYFNKEFEKVMNIFKKDAEKYASLQAYIKMHAAMEVIDPNITSIKKLR